MTSAAADGPVGIEERKRRYAFPLFVVCILGVVLRIVIGYHGGIWADEGFFLLVANAPSWGAMMDFLRFHESHPPLFYALMRVWTSAVGTSDIAVLAVPVAIGIGIVPAIYLSGEKLFSSRTGLIAAFLAAISPALLEFSGQMRPYGLLPLLTLISCATLASAIDKGGWRVWAAYIVSTTMLVYTHNWSWLVVGGQVAAVAFLLIAGGSRRPVLRPVLLSWAVIFIAYSPWWSTLLFQVAHAGHPPLVVQDWSHAVELAALALPAAVVMSLFGSLPGVSTLMTIAALTAAAAAVTSMVVARRKQLLSFDVSTTIFLVVPAVAVIAVVALSSRTNLLLPRCLAMLAPLVIVLLARSIDVQNISATISRVAMSLVAVASIVGVFTLARTTRSNVREVAARLLTVAKPNDLVIVIPEWYAASFSHYFKQPVEEIDYPNPGRGGMVDFSHVFDRVADDTPVARLGARIRAARATSQRVWLITGRAYSRRVSPQELANAIMYRQSPTLSVNRVQQISDSLRLAYGDADTTIFVRGQSPRYDEVLPFLFAPKPSPDSGAARR